MPTSRPQAAVASLKELGLAPSLTNAEKQRFSDILEQRLAAVEAARAARWRRRLDQAIEDAAPIRDRELGQIRRNCLPIESEALVEPANAAFELWEAGIARIDARLGQGALGVQLKRLSVFGFKFEKSVRFNPRLEMRALEWPFQVLDFLIANNGDPFSEPSDPHFEWMSDFLFLKLIPMDWINEEATKPGKRYDRVLRKRPSVIDARERLAEVREQLDLEDVHERRRLGGSFRKGLHFINVPRLAAVLNEALNLRGEVQYSPRLVLPPPLTSNFTTKDLRSKTAQE